MYGTSKTGTNNIYFDDYGIKWFWKIKKSIWKILRSYKNVTRQVCNRFQALCDHPFWVSKQQKKRFANRSIYLMWSPLASRHLLNTFYGLYFSHHIQTFVKEYDIISLLSLNLTAHLFVINPSLSISLAISHQCSLGLSTG